MHEGKTRVVVADVPARRWLRFVDDVGRFLDA
jgi:hypothetical protein